MVLFTPKLSQHRKHVFKALQSATVGMSMPCTSCCGGGGGAAAGGAGGGAGGGGPNPHQDESEDLSFAKRSDDVVETKDFQESGVVEGERLKDKDEYGRRRRRQQHCHGRHRRLVLVPPHDPNHCPAAATGACFPTDKKAVTEASLACSSSSSIVPWAHLRDGTGGGGSESSSSSSSSACSSTFQLAREKTALDLAREIVTQKTEELHRLANTHDADDHGDHDDHSSAAVLTRRAHVAHALLEVQTLAPSSPLPSSAASASSASASSSSPSSFMSGVERVEWAVAAATDDEDVSSDVGSDDDDEEEGESRGSRSGCNSGGGSRGGSVCCQRCPLLRVVLLQTNWLGSDAPNGYYREYLDLDRDEDGMLSLQELSLFRRPRSGAGDEDEEAELFGAPMKLSSAFLKRVFEELVTFRAPTNQGKEGRMDYRLFLDLALAVDAVKNYVPPKKGGSGGGGQSLSQAKNSFLTSAAAVKAQSVLGVPQALAYFWLLLDINKTGYLDLATLAYFYGDVRRCLLTGDGNDDDDGAYADAAEVSDVLNELMDMVKPLRPELGISLADLVNCGVGHTVVTILIDAEGFILYDRRESLMQQHDGDDDSDGDEDNDDDLVADDGDHF